MILSALNDCYQRLLEDPDSDIAAPGYSQEKIGYAIVLAEDGRVVDIHDLRDSTAKKPLPRLLSVPQPEKRTVAVKANFLWDKSSYVLGVSAGSKRSEQEHLAFKTLHQQQLAGSDDPGLQALLRFLESWSPPQFAQEAHFVRHAESLLDANLVFRLDGDRAYLHERAAARQLWSQLQAHSEAASTGMCLVSGQRAALARLHPAIKGVNDAQSAGASIVSFNLDAFTSYGKQQGENAPICEQAAFAYTTALNHLLRRDAGNRQRLQIGDSTVVFWAQGHAQDNAAQAEELMALLLGLQVSDAQATQRLHDVLAQIGQARPLRELDSRLDDRIRIHVLGLAPNAARLSIRFWETQSLGLFVQWLAEHYRDLELQPPAWRQPPSPHYLAMQVAPFYDGKPKAEDVPPQLAGELSRAILAGTRYPRSLLAAIVMRLRADGQISPLRVALCKAVLAREAREARLDRQQALSTTKEEPPVSLDPGHTDPGYLLGRLFSTLENVQRAALGTQLNATIRDRYYGAASATPAGVFPVLLRNAQNHMSRLRKDKPGLAVALEKEIGQIVDLLPSSLPRSLRLESQGRFAIGYYHQTQARFARNEGQHAADTESESEGASA
jgi:CRISPR-associated protein Csd1